MWTDWLLLLQAVSSQKWVLFLQGVKKIIIPNYLGKLISSRWNINLVLIVWSSGNVPWCACAKPSLTKCPDSNTTFHTDSKNLYGNVCLKSKTCLQESSVLLFFFPNVLTCHGVESLNVIYSLLSRREESRTNFGSFGIITRKGLCSHNTNCPSSSVCHNHPQVKLREGNVFSRVCLSVCRLDCKGGGGGSTSHGSHSPITLTCLNLFTWDPIS